MKLLFVQNERKCFYFFFRRFCCRSGYLLETIKYVFDRTGIWYSAPYFPGLLFRLRVARNLSEASTAGFRDLDLRKTQAELEPSSCSDVCSSVFPSLGYFSATLHSNK